MTPSILELEALFTLLYAIFRRDQVYVVRLKTGGEPKLYPLARAVLKGMGGTYNPKNQEHIFTIDLDPVTMINTSASGKILSVDAKTVCFRALEQGSKIKAEEGGDHPASFKSLELLTAVEIVPDKFEVWLGDNPLGHILFVKESWRARIANKQINVASSRIEAVVNLLEAAGVDFRALGLTEIIWPDGTIESLEAIVGSAPTSEPNPNTTALTESLGEAEPLSLEHARVLEDAQMVLLEQINADTDLQARAKTNQDTIDEYAAKILAGATFPAVDLYFDGKQYFLADGFHRFQAHKDAGRTWINAKVQTGSKRDAQLEATGANKDHGLQRTRQDKRNAVLVLLRDEEWCLWSDRRIGEHVGVDGKTVANIREELETTGEIATARTRVSTKGTAVPIKKHEPEPDTQPLGFVQSETKPGLEHGSTRGDTRRVFKSVVMQDVTLDFGAEFAAESQAFALSSTPADASTDQTPEIHGNIEHSVGEYVWRAGRAHHVLTARSWTGAVIEALGDLGIVDPDLEITWVNSNGEAQDAPVNPVSVDAGAPPLTAQILMRHRPGEDQPSYRMVRRINDRTIEFVAEVRQTETNRLEFTTKSPKSITTLAASVVSWVDGALEFARKQFPDHEVTVEWESNLGTAISAPANTDHPVPTGPRDQVLEAAGYMPGFTVRDDVLGVFEQACAALRLMQNTLRTADLYAILAEQPEAREDAFRIFQEDLAEIKEEVEDALEREGFEVFK